MLDRVGEWATALTDVVSLPVWAVAAIGAVLVLACALAFVRAGGGGRSVPSPILVRIRGLGCALGGWGGGRELCCGDPGADPRAGRRVGRMVGGRSFPPPRS